MTSRRSWAVGTAICAWSLAGCSARSAEIIRGVALTGHVRVIPHDEGNLVLLDARDGRVLVDTRTTANREADGLKKLGLRFVVTCHPQGPGNAGLPKGAVLVCHQKAVSETEQETNVAFRSTLDLSLGKSKLHCYHKGAAFTDGDCQVYIPDDQVLVVGALVQPGRHAEVDPEGRTDLRSWARVLRDLYKDHRAAERLQVVPTRGETGPAQLLLDQADYLDVVLDFAATAHRHGMTLEEMLADAGNLEQRFRNRAGKPEKALLRLAYDTTAQ